MISVEEAKKRVQSSVKTSRSEILPLHSLVGRTLAEDVYAPINMPPFAQSAMDGYAVRREDLVKTKTLQLQSESKAGSSCVEDISEGKCVRIFTGAPTPANATAVIMQEKAKVVGDKITFDVDELKELANIRPIGEQMSKGELALQKGTRLNAGSVGFLASLGLVESEVYVDPKIAIIVTGDELVQPGEELGFGEVYESNSITLVSALQEVGRVDVKIEFVQDDYIATVEKLNDLKGRYDFLIFTGGISVGDYDYTGKALEELRTECIFYKVKQKPGKPLYFGKLDETYVFGLPGNPAAVLTCFYQYVYPAIQLFSGESAIGLKSIQMPLAHDFEQSAGRALFLKAKMTSMSVELLGKQASSMLASFTETNALVYISPEDTSYRKGDLVETFILPA